MPLRINYVELLHHGRKQSQPHDINQRIHRRFLTGSAKVSGTLTSDFVSPRILLAGYGACETYVCYTIMNNHELGEGKYQSAAFSPFTFHLPPYYNMLRTIRLHFKLENISFFNLYVYIYGYVCKVCKIAHRSKLQFYRISPFTLHLSPFACHLSPFTFHLSPFTFID